MLFRSGGARRLPDGFPPERGRRQLIDAARLAAEIADRFDITIVMEPLFRKATNTLNSVEEGIAFVDAVTHPRLRLLADLFHMHAEHEPFAHLPQAGARLAHMHLATPSLPETGAGPDYDYPAFVAAVRQARYTSRFSVEDNPGLFRGQDDLLPAYRAVVAHLRGQFASA